MTSALPVAVIIHPGAPLRFQIFTEVLENLHKRRIIRNRDTIIFNKGYYSYKNYQIRISKYKNRSTKFSQKKISKLQKLDNTLTYPLKVFKEKKETNTSKKVYNTLKKILIEKNQTLETIQTHTRQNRRLFQIMQIRTKHEKITQIHTQIS